MAKFLIVNPKDNLSIVRVVEDVSCLNEDCKIQSGSINDLNSFKQFYSVFKLESCLSRFHFPDFLNDDILDEDCDSLDALIELIGESYFAERIRDLVVNGAYETDDVEYDVIHYAYFKLGTEYFFYFEESFGCSTFNVELRAHAGYLSLDGLQLFSLVG